jgi:hypothetical protein
VRRFAELDDETRLVVWEALQAREYYLLTGSGTSLDSTGLKGQMSSVSTLTKRLCEVTNLPNNKSLPQAYKLLSDDQKTSEITERYTCTSVGETALTLMSVPWKRIYTLNVDNCLQFAVKTITENVESKIETEVFVFSDDFRDIKPEYVQSIVHLHGYVDKPEPNYVFSHIEYSRMLSRPNSWMLILTQLMNSEPFIVAGTTLDEIDVTYYLENRTCASTDTTGIPSILIEPFPDQLTERLCADHGFVLFEGTYIDFHKKMLLEFGGWRNIYADTQNLMPYIPTGVTNREKISFLESFSEVPKFVDKAKKAARFLLGAELDWSIIEANLDTRREIYFDLERKISACVKDGIRIFLVFDQLGSGKSSILRRLAYKISKREKHVFFFTGKELIEEEECAKIINRISSPVYIFVDNIADHTSYINKILKYLSKNDIVFVGTERTYRKNYVEDGFPDEDIAIVESQLNLREGESKRLIRSYQSEGLSEKGNLSDIELSKFAKQISNDSISIAACRIQNSFYSFDKIVAGLVGECDDEEIKTYLIVALARHCFSGGVHKSVLAEAAGYAGRYIAEDNYARLPMTFASFNKGFVLPSQSVIADRVVSIVRRDRPMWLFDAMVALANSLSPRVNRQQIRARSPASKLAGGLMDFDRVVKRFIDEQAEQFYDNVKENWGWNARYWEQRALLNLDRFLVSKNDPSKLAEAIQNARYAFSIEQHPLSLTTLAKMLFAAVDMKVDQQEEIFREGWTLINESIDIESKWTNIRPTVFIVCFKGVLSFVRNGGLLDGEQAERLRDVLATTHHRKLKGRNLDDLRSAILSEAF